MQELIKVVCPTYKRDKNVKALKVFKSDLILAVHKFEVDKYKANHPDNQIMVLPDAARGNMAKVRNYIRDNCKTRYLVMVDDDVVEIGYHENMKQNPIGLKRIYEFLENGFRICEELKTILWGINLQADPRFYMHYTPFQLLGPVLGPFCCHIVDNTKEIYYDERLSLNEDYDYALQVLWRYHKIFRNNKYYYKAGHLTEKGGCAAYRTLNKEIEQSEIMIKKWGNKAVAYNFSKSTNPRVRVPLAGV